MNAESASRIRFPVRDVEERSTQKRRGAISSRANSSTSQNSAAPSGDSGGQRTGFQKLYSRTVCV